MPPPRSSRRRFQDYRQKLKERQKRKGGDTAEAPSPLVPESLGESKKHKPRSRPFLTLLSEFWKLLRGHRTALAVALVALSASTLLGLIPLYGTKVVFDSVLRDPPLPHRLPHWLPQPQNPRQLLALVAVAMVALAAASEAFGIWSRWQTTRMTKRVQVAVRKTVFDHAVRLPLHRVY